MIKLKISRTNSINGSWKCEEPNKIEFTDSIGIGNTIQEAIKDFLECYKTIKGFTPDYKWS